MDFTVGIKPDVEGTFGKLIFGGFKRDKFVFDSKTNQVDRDKLESKIYNLMSSVQGEQIEVAIPGHIAQKEINFGSEVKLENPRIKARAQANGNFANIIWTITADDFSEIGGNFAKKA